MRKEFALQLASTSFMTYLICIGSRLPSRLHWSRSTGQIAMSESIPFAKVRADILGQQDEAEPDAAEKEVGGSASPER